MPSYADELCHLCCNALQPPKRGDSYEYNSQGPNDKVYRSWNPVRAWFDEHSREDANETMQDRDKCYAILNHVYLKDAPQDIVDRFVQLDRLTLLQLCMLALSRAKEPYDDERRSNSWDPVRKWFESAPPSPEEARTALEETNHVSETVLECVGWKQAPKDICNSMAKLQKIAAGENNAGEYAIRRRPSRATGFSAHSDRLRGTRRTSILAAGTDRYRPQSGYYNEGHSDQRYHIRGSRLEGAASTIQPANQSAGRHRRIDSRNRHQHTGGHVRQPLPTSAPSRSQSHIDEPISLPQTSSATDAISPESEGNSVSAQRLRRRFLPANRPPRFPRTRHPVLLSPSLPIPLSSHQPAGAPIPAAENSEDQDMLGGLITQSTPGQTMVDEIYNMRLHETHDQISSATDANGGVRAPKHLDQPQSTREYTRHMESSIDEDTRWRNNLDRMISDHCTKNSSKKPKPFKPGCKNVPPNSELQLDRMLDDISDLTQYSTMPKVTPGPPSESSSSQTGRDGSTKLEPGEDRQAEAISKSSGDSESQSLDELAKLIQRHVKSATFTLACGIELPSSELQLGTVSDDVSMITLDPDIDPDLVPATALEENEEDVTYNIFGEPIVIRKKKAEQQRRGQMPSQDYKPGNTKTDHFEEMLERKNHSSPSQQPPAPIVPGDPTEQSSVSANQSENEGSNEASREDFTTQTEEDELEFSLLELCGKALYPDIEEDESKRINSWMPVREWFDRNPECQVSSLLQNDSRGCTPLHIACHKKAPIDIIILMLENDQDSAAARTKDKSEESHMPLHWACSGAYCCPEVILHVFEAYPKGATEKSTHGITPFFVAHPGVIEDLVRFILESDYQKLNLVKEFMSPDLFQDAVMKNLSCSENCIRWLNMMSCSRRVVFFMMMELYLHIAMILSFVQASMLHITGEVQNAGWALGILPLAGAFLALEVWQFWGYMIINQPSGYFLDLWNWIDLTSISLAITSAIKFLTEESGVINTGDLASFQRLLMVTGFFLCICFVSYLRKTFFAFAIFVGGIVNIIWVLTPFLVVSFLLLFAFAFGYYVQNSKDEYHTLERAFLGIFSLFVGGEEEAESALDVVFGSLIVIVLLNVVIAVVGQAWQDVTRNSKAVFWKFRLRFILEVTRGSKHESSCCGSMFGIRKILDEDWTTTSLKQYFGLTPYHERQRGLYHNTTRGKRDNLFQVGVTIFLLSLSTILGIISFGMLWPMFVLEFLFTSKAESSVSDGKTNKELDAVEELTSENHRQSEQIESLIFQMEILSRNMEMLVQQATSSRAEVVMAEEIDNERENGRRRSIDEKSQIPVAVPYPHLPPDSTESVAIPDNAITSDITAAEPSDLNTCVCRAVSQANSDAEAIRSLSQALIWGIANSTATELVDCLTRLWELARKSEDNAMAIMLDGVTLAAIIKTMEAHHEKSVKITAIGTLWSLAMYPDIRESIVIHGGCEAIIKTMNTNIENEDLQLNALGVLKVLTFNTSGKSAMASHSSLVAYIMQTYRSNSTIQEEGCAILGNLAADLIGQSVAPNIVKEMAAILSSILDHPDSSEVHEAACFALMNLSVSETIVNILRSNEMTKPALELASEKNSEMVQSQIITILDRLGFDNDNAQTSPPEREDSIESTREI